MGVTVRLGADAVELASLDTRFTVDPNAVTLSALADDRITVSQGNFDITVAGRQIDDFFISGIFPFSLSTYEAIGIRFVDVNLFLTNFETAGIDFTNTLARLEPQLNVQPLPTGILREEFEALGQRTGLTLDIDRLIDLAARVEALGLANSTSQAFNDPTVLEALGIEVMSAPIVTPDITQLSVAESGQLLFSITGDDLSAILNGAEIDQLLAGDDVVIGSGGDDRLDGLIGADEMIGGDGNDRYVIENAGDTIIENPGGGEDRADVLINIPDFRAPENVELVVLLDGSVAATSPNSGGRLVGVNDDNIFLSGPGTDSYDGNAGIDELSYENATAGVSASLLKPTAFNTGGAGTDKIDDIENLTGSNFDDVLVGAQGVSNVIRGLDGNDLIVGFAGPDQLSGGAGADTFAYNRLNFRDSLAGGGEDSILDFSPGEDVIDLSRLGVSSDQVTLAPGQLSADVDNDGTADFAIFFANGAAPALSDIVGLTDDASTVIV